MIVTNRMLGNPRLQKAFPNGFEPTFHPERLNQPKKVRKPSKIFTVDMGDLFGAWVPIEWIEKVLKVIEDCPQHTFQLLTKNPRGYFDVKFPANCWLGTTVEHSGYSDRIIDLLNVAGENPKWVSYEPIMGTPPIEELDGIDWVVVGERTGTKFDDVVWQDNIDQARAMIEWCEDQEIPIFVKNKLGTIFPQREFPK
jgi:protein gp37